VSDAVAKGVKPPGRPEYERRIPTSSKEIKTEAPR
jgi:hypothetical protein